MDLQSIMLSEINQTQKDKGHRILLICGIYKTHKTKQKQAHRYREQTDGGQGEGINKIVVIKTVTRV